MLNDLPNKRNDSRYLSNHDGLKRTLRMGKLKEFKFFFQRKWTMRFDICHSTRKQKMTATISYSLKSVSNICKATVLWLGRLREWTNRIWIFENCCLLKKSNANEVCFTANSDSIELNNLYKEQQCTAQNERYGFNLQLKWDMACKHRTHAKLWEIKRKKKANSDIEFLRKTMLYKILKTEKHTIHFLRRCRHNGCIAECIRKICAESGCRTHCWVSKIC